MNLRGKVVLLTGAGSGIGEALAVALSARGAVLVLTGRRREALEATRARTSNPARVSIEPADITKMSGRLALRRTLEQNYGRLDVLINNAGLVDVELLDNTTDKSMQAMVDTNLVAPMALTREMLPLLAKAAPSRVVNVGSMFGDIAFPYFAAYSATKFAVRGFSDALRRELAPKAIGVTYCAPRATKTPAAGNFTHLVEPFAMKFDTAAAVAEAIVAGIEKDKRSGYPLGPERFFVLMQRLFPSAVDGALIKQFEKARAALRR